MAEKGFKRKLATILSTDAKRYRRFVYDPEEPMPHNLMTYRTSMKDLAQQYRFNELCWPVGCDELQR